MSEDEIYAELDDVFRDFFADSSITLKPETSAGDIEGWDSLNHLSLMIAIEGRFGIRFQTQEIEKLTRVGDLAALIQSKRTT
jgi:acyl carrier protein